MVVALKRACSVRQYYLLYDSSHSLVEMLQAELMISHDTIVLHATRLSGDRERMIQQLALACFHFQLLEHKES